MSKFTEEEIKAAVEQANKSEDKYVSSSNQPLLFNATRQMTSHHSVAVNEEEHIFSQDFMDDMFTIHAVYRVGGEWGPTLLREVSYHKRETVTCPLSGKEFFSEDGIEYNGQLCSPEVVDVCAYSGEVHLKSEMTETQDGFVFDDYLEGHYSRCEECGEWVNNDKGNSAYKRGSEVFVCNDCLSDYYFSCSDCDDYFHNDDDHYVVRSGDSICSSCIEHYAFCNSCEEWVHEDVYNFDADMCYDCYRERDRGIIQDYHEHSRQRMLFFQYDKKQKKTVHQWSYDTSNFKGLGVELEVEGPEPAETAEKISSIDGLFHEDYDERNELIFEHDGSLDDDMGMEIITRPHDKESFFRMPWEAILKTLTDNGFKSHDAESSCGLHVHVSREVFGRTRQEQSRAIAKVYRFFNENWDDVSKFSRRNNFRWCQRVPVPNSRNVKDIMDKARSVRSNLGSHSVALNNANSDTLEFRLGRGTLRLASFLAWVDFIVAVAWNARKITFNEIGNLDRWLEGIRPETAREMKAKGVFLGAEVIKAVTETA